MLLAYSKEGVANTYVTPWQIEFDAFAETLRTPDIGDKDGAYFIRGGQFNGKVYRDDKHLLAADLLVLDGDKRLIQDTGEVIKGAVDPILVHEVLKMLDITHLIYSSHSNDRDYHRYRVCVPVPLANADELRVCVDWLIAQLHQNGVWLATVDENYSWSRPWYTPRVPDATHADLFRFYEHDGGEPFPKDAALAWHAARQATPDRTITAEQTTRSLVAKLGRRLRTGDGRRPLLISYLASLSSCGSDAAALHKSAASFAAELFDPNDPPAETDVDGIIRWLVKRDADRPKNQQRQPAADEPLDIFAPQLAPPLELTLLPPVLADYCGSNAQALGVEPGAILLPTLVGLAAVAGLNLSVSLRRHAHWIEQPILWGLACGGPGTTKGPAMRAALRPFNAVADAVVSASAKLFAQWQEEVKRDRKEAPDRPPWVQLKLDDITVEAVAELASQNPRGLYGAYEELTEWLGRMDAYGSSSGKDRPFWLKAFDGVSATVNRRHAAPLVIDTLGVSLYGGIQPARVKELVGKAGGSGDGLTQRFLPIMLGQPGASLDCQVEGVDAVSRIASYLRSFTPTTEFPLDDDAYDIFEESRRLFLELCQTYPGSAGFEGHLAKCPGITGRLALILHAVACADARHIAGVVSGATMQTAADLMRRYFLPHAKAFYEGDMARGEQTPRGLAQKVGEWLLSSNRTEAVSSRDLMRHVSAFNDASQALREAAIAELEQAEWLFEIVLDHKSGRGRPPGARFEINPRIHAAFGELAARCRTQRDRWMAAWSGR